MKKPKFKKLNKEAKEKWLQALRSGDYKQGTGDLQSGGCFCCLGVLEKVIKGKVKKHQSASWPSCGDQVRLSRPACRRLITMNDVEKKSFAQIADWIEENL